MLAGQQSGRPVRGTSLETQADRTDGKTKDRELLHGCNLGVRQTTGEDPKQEAER